MNAPPMFIITLLIHIIHYNYIKNNLKKQFYKTIFLFLMLKNLTYIWYTIYKYKYKYIKDYLK